MLTTGILGLTTAWAAPRDGEWKRVDEAREKDQPKTVIELLTGIEKAAFAEGAWAEGTRALASRIATLAQIEEDARPIQVLEAAIPTAPEQARPALRALSAWWLSGYYQQNQWRFMQRSSTAAPPGDDIESWDLARILTEVDARFQASLADAEALKKIPVAEFAPLLTDGSLGDAVQPTMYDFIAQRALDFYTSEEVAVSRPAEPFRIAADSPVFAEVAEFLSWQPEVKRADEPKARALEIYRGLLAFHQADEDRTALLMADLDRLEWAADAADAEGRDARMEAALRRFIEAHAPHPASARARLMLGEMLREENPKEAHAIFLAGAQAFPEHPFGKFCRNEVNELEARELSLFTESQWTPAGESIRVTHRNLNQLWFRIYSVPFPGGAGALHEDPQPLPGPEMKPLREWSAELPDDGDYRSRESTFAAPADLASGYYLVVASAREDFRKDDNVVAVAGVHVTPLAMVVRGAASGGIEGSVVEAVTGAPVAGVEVTLHVQREDGQGTRETKVRTDAEGHFKSDGTIQRNFVAIARRGLERAVARGWGSGQWSNRREVFTAAVFFTDRALYRPGQTVHFKGILCAADPQGGNYRVLAGEKDTVYLMDPNGREVATVDVVTNERGSFSGTFTAPEGAVLGACRMGVRKHQGMAMLRVEEYKRPKFFTEIDAPGEPASLGKAVRVKVRGESYTGAPIDGAKVAWRVTREARLPLWTRWCWWAPPLSGETEEIAQGVAETAADGSVMIEFTARPDLSLREDLEPVFDFVITADVTDGSGETRSATRTVPLAYTALTAEIVAEDWLEAGKELELTVRTRSHGGEGIAAKGVLKIHRLKEPATCPRPESGGRMPWTEGQSDPTDPNRWEPGEVVAELPVETDATGKATLKQTLAAGAYRAIYETEDANGREVKAMRGIQVVAADEPDFPTMLPFFTGSPSWSVEPGNDAVLLWGSGHESARACVEWRWNGELIRREWSAPGRTQQAFRLAIEEKHRGGVSVSLWQVTRNRLHQFRQTVDVPWTNKRLKLRWERLVSKLEPGAKETWTAVIEGAGGEAAAAEMVATLYDASLDAFAPHAFRDLASMLRREYEHLRPWQFSSGTRQLQPWDGFKREEPFGMDAPYREWIEELEIFEDRGFGIGGGGATVRRFAMRMKSDQMEMLAAPASVMDMAADGAVAENMSLGQEAPEPAGDVAVRENLNETAFFFPDLTSGGDGTVRMTFTMPEALTKWRFLGMAHDGDFRSGLLEGETVTAKDLMVQPNPPRFLREGDELWFTVKITNTADREQTGTARLTLADAASDEDRSAALGITAPDQPFTVPAKESRTLRWKITVPDGAGFLKYKAVASSGDLSDGEAGWLPVIPRRILVTESLSLPVRDAGTREFDFTKLSASGGSETLENRFLHVQVVSQPAWYAVMALPYLMEFPHDCSEQTFNRYYANALARHIAASDPKMRRVFEQWKAAGGEALDSPLQKNADLKGILLEETPWLRDAQDESAARRRVGLLFDDNHMERELTRSLQKLQQMQLGDGLWPWFPGGRGDEYITRYVVAGFARLRALGVATDITPAMRALEALDASLTRRYHELARAKALDQVNLDPTVAFHLYTRTFFLKDKALSAENRVAFDYFAGQGRKHWTGLRSRMSRAHTALALHRLGEKEVPALITRSLKEHATVSEELGMYWKDAEGEGWWWWQAPVETQAMMIEAFRDIDADAKAVEDCQVWLIKQKQVGDWKTTKATADATHALLMGGKNLLASDALLRISLGGREVMPQAVEAGTGMYEGRFVQEQVKPELGKITLTKTDPGVAWASVHWQYLEDMAKVSSHGQGAMTLEKALFLRRNTDRGPVLEPVTGPVKVGDELVTRVVLKNDRAMEYVHLKDLRGSGTEPVNVLSGYRWQDGFGYYEVTRDTASHFFIDRLPPGTHVFETSVRIQHAGKYQTGTAEIRCMYAPEFNAHSGSVEVTVE
jgi:hypothetical protein